MAKRIYVYRREHAPWIIGIILTLLALGFFLWYYFRNKPSVSGGEKCPDGRDIPSNGDCSSAAPVIDTTGAIIVKPQTPDSNGCIPVSKYTPASFPLGLGMYGASVTVLQNNLNTYFNAGLKADGYFGCKTLAVVIKNLSVQSVDMTLFNNPSQWGIPPYAPTGL